MINNYTNVSTKPDAKSRYFTSICDFLGQLCCYEWNERRRDL